MPGVFSKGRGSSGPSVSSINTRTPAFALSSSFDGSGVSSSLQRLGSPGQQALSQRFPRILNDIDTLRGTVRPGFSDVRQARLNAVRDARSRGLGNLRDNLARRRVLGSSFGEAALASAEREFGREEANQQAQSFLEEFEANRTLLGQEFQTIATELQRELNELQIAGAQGSNLASLIETARQFDQQIAFQRSQARANTIGSILGLGVSQLGFGGAFGPGGAFGSELALPGSGSGGFVPLTTSALAGSA